MSYKSPIDLIYDEPTIKIKENIDEAVYSAIASIGINIDKQELIRALNYDRQQYEKGEWDMFELITSAIYGKQCYFIEDGGIYSRISGICLEGLDEAVKEFLEWSDRE